MPAGAALPKDTSAVRSSIRGNVKVVCRHFPGCDGYAYLSAAAIRSRRIPTCYCGSGELIPASPAACMILRPDLLDVHPDHDELSQLAHLNAEAWKGEPCASCGEPPGDPYWDRDLWYCYRCGGVNERQGDGTLGWFKASPRSPEAEKCRGLRADKPRARVRKVAPARERVGAAPRDAIPF